MIAQYPFQLTVQVIVNLLLSQLPPVKQITRRGKLNLEERIELYRLKMLSRLSVTQIAKRIKRTASTISRELKRNRPLLKIHGMDCYSVAKHAQDKADLRKATKRHKERLKSPERRDAVEAMLKTRISPELISERLYLEKGIIISHESIYQLIYAERPELIKYLPRGAKKYHPRGATKKSRKKKGQPAAPKASIDLRPKRVSNRLEFGHWEMDTIISKQSKECL